jgi:predicted ribosome quality control (RQC) complex YloA/Tae2 family protein
MKQKFTLVDVAASAACVRYECLRMRLANVYDTSNRSYIFKLYESGGGSGSATKVLLLLEAGARFHTTSFSRESQSSHPNSFALKLRKHLRGRRLNDAQQVGCDRVLDLSFGFGDSCHHVILELYGQGNIILCDAHYRILSLLRSHRDDNKGIQIMPKFFYPFQNTCRPYSRFDHLHVVDALRNRSSKGASAVLSKLLPYGATYANSFAQTAACELDYAEQNAAFPERVADKVLEFERWLERLSEVECRPLGGHKPEYTGSSWRGLPPPSGYIIYTGGPEDDPKHNMYEEFAPFELVQFGRRKHDCFDRFSTAADEYFSRIESQRLQAQRAQAEQSAMNKLERVRSDVNRRVEGLRDKAIKEETSARLLEKNLYEVGQAIDSVNALITSGLSWSNVGQVVQDEQRRGNHIACLIHSLDLPHNTIKLHLTSETDSDNDDETADNFEDLETRQTGKSALVNVDLNLSAYGNASKHFEARKVHEVKRGKTLAQSDVAVKQAQQKTNKQLQAARTKSQVKEARKEHFFEKFRFFISSEGFLVLAGRDAQQNDMLVKRYMSNGDVYIHADVQGAASIVVRNRRGKEQPIPPLTLQQAGQFCICHSQAWNNGIVTSAWWVHPHQVSKSAPTGEYLQTGAFMIRGKKNYLPPSQLVLGFTFLFRCDIVSAI